MALVEECCGCLVPSPPLPLPIRIHYKFGIFGGNLERNQKNVEEDSEENSERFERTIKFYQRRLFFFLGEDEEEEKQSLYLFKVTKRIILIINQIISM